MLIYLAFLTLCNRDKSHELGCFVSVGAKLESNLSSFVKLESVAVRCSALNFNTLPIKYAMKNAYFQEGFAV